MIDRSVSPVVHLVVCVVVYKDIHVVFDAFFRTFAFRMKRKILSF